MKLKKELLALCLAKTAQKLTILQSSLASIQESRDNETKSSVGDKYETGRAMMQMEEEKIMGQIQNTQLIHTQLQQIDPLQQSPNIQIGSLVFTNTGRYFISASIGKVSYQNQIYYCISVDAPISQHLLQKKAGDEFSFNNRLQIIKRVV